MASKNEFIQYKSLFENELQDNILSYWMKYGVEKEGNGFYPAVDLDNHPVLSANKTCVLNARILWTFAAAAKMFPGKGYEEFAHKAWKVVTEDFADKEHGGYFMELSSSNEVVNDIKHTYAQAFVIYSLCKYYEFNPTDEVMKVIQDFFYTCPLFIPFFGRVQNVRCSLVSWRAENTDVYFRIECTPNKHARRGCSGKILCIFYYSFPKFYLVRHLGIVYFHKTR